MRDRSLMVATAVLLLLAPDARAQLPSCGAIDYANDIYQNGSLSRVWVQANTFREAALCPVELQTEAWVWGAGTAVAGRGVYSSPVMLGQLVPFWGKWESQGKHWVIFSSSPQTWVYFADSHDETAVSAPESPPPIWRRRPAIDSAGRAGSARFVRAGRHRLPWAAVRHLGPLVNRRRVYSPIRCREPASMIRRPAQLA